MSAVLFVAAVSFGGVVNAQCASKKNCPKKECCQSGDKKDCKKDCKMDSKAGATKPDCKKGDCKCKKNAKCFKNGKCKAGCKCAKPCTKKKCAK